MAETEEILEFMAEFEEIMVDPFKETGKDVQSDSVPSDGCSGREMERNDSDGDPLHVKNDLYPSDECSGREMKRADSDVDPLYVQNNSDASDVSSCRECKRDDSDREIKEIMADSLHLQNDSDSSHEPTCREWKSDDSDGSDESSDEERKMLIQKIKYLLENKPVRPKSSDYIPETEYGVYDKSVYEYTRLSEILKMETWYRFSWDDMWDREPIIDLQYLFLYDYMKDNHMDKVIADRHVILLRGECKSQTLANELASQYHHCSVPMSEFDIDYCLTDLVEEYMVLEELEIFKRYELFLLKQYQENAECKDGPYYPKPPSEFKEPTPKFITYRYSFVDVEEGFRDWIKKLENSTDAEKLEALERSNEERKLRFRLNTRATFVREKLQMANEDGIICLKDLHSEIENNLGETPQSGKVESVLMKYCSDQPVII